MLLVCGIWSYWPSLVNLVGIWSRVVDYAHGFFVIPLALYFLWVRRDRYPGCRESSPLLALAFLCLSLALRHVGDAFYFAFLDGWSLVPWAASVCALLGGRPLLRWCWPSLLFLLFMVPLPFSLENNLSGPLQRVATVLSTQALQFLGQPGFAEGNVIVLGDQRLEVAQACSGLRLFVGIVALTYAYVVVLRRPLWEKVALIAAAPAIAIVSNAARIVVTGLLCRLLLPGPTARAWIHDGSGWVMILLAAGLFWLWLRYLKLLVKEEEVMDMMAVVKQCRA
ncbi:MAG TPA: exosortase/archaeosortase family protein [Pirellulaceae bacterium]|nr:exosortase/archaeosortase family protein [Pirellulaceae bacterium]